MIEPNGPLPPEIYWRRRIVAGLALAAILALVVALIVWTQTGGDDARNASATGSPSSSSAAPPSTATTPPSVDPSQAPSGGGTGDGGTAGGGTGDSAGAGASASAPASTGSGAAAALTPTPAAGEVPLCTDSSIAVVLYTDKPTYTVGNHPVFTLVITNAGLSPCLRDVGTAAQNVIIRTLDGTRTLWSAQDCLRSEAPNNQILQPKQQITDTIRWSGTTSSPGCNRPRTVVGAGQYQATAKLGEKESAPITFNVVAPAQ
ncbi:MAG: hypothetical protein QM662_01210 [Gordonia sp. (in: high G+C Gram-positive bacteria)]